jgi:hypothetical protein
MKKLDRVTRKLLLFKKVVSLVIEDDTLYVIHTGNIGGLDGFGANLGAGAGAQGGMNGSTASQLGVMGAGKVLNAYQKQLIAGEEQLEKQGAAAMLGEHKKNLKIPLSDIASVNVHSDTNPTKCTITSISGNKVSLEFMYIQEDAWRSFVEALNK